jgi:hypothetical protein
VTLYDGATAEPITCTITAAANSCSDTTHTFTPAVGDLLTWQIAPTGTVVITPNIQLAANWGTTTVSNGMSQLQKIVVSGTSTTSVTFSSIPTGYTSLRIDELASSSDSAVQEVLYCQINGDTTSGDYAGELWGGSTSAFFSAQSGTTNGVGCSFINGSTAYANSPATASILIPYYLQTTFNKTISTVAQYAGATTFGGNGTLFVNDSWKSTAAVTSITLSDTAGGHFIAGSTFTLYGIL